MRNEEILAAIKDLMEQKLGGLEQKLENLDHRVAGLEQKLENLDHRVAGLEREVKRQGEVLVSLCDRMDHMEKRMDRMEKRMDRAESRISALQAGQIDIRKDIRIISEKLDMAHDTAVECWGQNVESQKRIELLEKKTQHLPEPKAG